MEFEREKREARRLLDALDQGTQGASATWSMVEEADPALVHFVFSWLRANYPATHPASDAILGRLAELCTRFPKAVRIANQGAEDPVVEWFEDAYAYQDLDAAEFIDLVVEKLEG